MSDLKMVTTFHCPREFHKEILTVAKTFGEIIPDGNYIWCLAKMGMSAIDPKPRDYLDSEKDPNALPPPIIPPIKAKKKSTQETLHLVLLHFDLEDIMAIECEGMTTLEAVRNYGEMMKPRMRNLLIENITKDQADNQL